MVPPSAPPSLPLSDISIVFLTAAPGTGKSSLCRRLVSRFPTLAHISVSALLRQTAAIYTAINTAAAGATAHPLPHHPLGATLNAAPSPASPTVVTPQQRALGEEIRRRMNVGLLVDDDVVLKLLVDAIGKKRREGYEALLIEGFPRTRRQALAFESFVQRNCVKCCVTVETSPTARLRRLRERWLLAGATASGMPTLPDREDEEEPTALDRLETFYRTNAEVEEFFRTTTAESKLVKVQAVGEGGGGGESGSGGGGGGGGESGSGGNKDGENKVGSGAAGTVEDDRGSAGNSGGGGGSSGGGGSGGGGEKVSGDDAAAASPAAESAAASSVGEGAEETSGTDANVNANPEEEEERELPELEVFQLVVDGIRPFLLRNLSVIFVVGGPGCGKGV